jgi:glycosyltransferase involved in cell wall biosynthesis
MAKIAIHQPRASYILGGAEAISIEMAKILSLKHEVSFVTSKAKNTENFNSFYKEYDGRIEFVFIESPLVFEFKDLGKLNAFDFESIIFGENSSKFYENNFFDVIALHYCTDLLMLNKRRALTVLHLHGYPKEERFINQISYRKADAIIGCSQFALKKTLEYFPDLKNNFYFYMRPDLDFYPDNTEKNIDILFIGRLIPRKGITTLIHALKRIENRFNQCVLAGSGPMEGEAKALIKGLNLENKIHCLGAVEKSKVIELMSKSKIFVHPATSREPFPTTLIEAMSLGVPVVSTIVGGIPEIITNSVNGILVEPGDEEQLSKALINLLEDNVLYRNIRSEGLKKIEREFDKDIKGLEFLNLYDKILEGLE